MQVPASPPLLGRDRELAELHAALRSAEAGSRGTIEGYCLSLFIVPALGLASACAGSQRDAPSPERQAASPGLPERTVAKANSAPRSPCVPPKHGDASRGPEEPEQDDHAYYGFFLAVSQRFTAHDAADVEVCCQEGHGDRLLVEYCSAATALLIHENDDAAFLETMPATSARIEASNELDLVLSDFDPAGQEPFSLYFRRAWQLAHAGNERAVEGFVVMFENSRGIFAELAEGALCPVFREQPALFVRLRPRHRAAVGELHAHCPPRN